ncbi:hypothetical protein ACET8U_06745 [Aeromonas veronii]|uniref:hypothetical protein n=1 Tax=Aeromonas veronii TaxID=654 RepID=UPI0038D2BB9B
MMLSEIQKEKLRHIISISLNKAEKNWDNGGSLLIESVNKGIGIESRDGFVMDSAEPSKIPGHDIVTDAETVIDEFVAFVADMRDSTKHLLCAISDKKAKVSGLQRVYYETSALLPSLGFIVSEENGSVTEYLGDGALALFRINPDDRSEAIYAAHRAAKNTIGDARTIINEILYERYNLPAIDLGVGLATSKALVTLVGLPPNMHPKAFGECVFRATKLSCGKNEIISDDNLKSMWPTAKGGTLRFISKKFKELNGYVLATS